MNLSEIKRSLSRLPLGDIRYFDSVGSTNDEALAWAANDTPDLSVVIADEQTAGRGRLDRKWFTPRGTALALSIVLRPAPEERAHLTRIVGLAALAVAEALRKLGLDPKIKWPNDILLQGSKTGGILIETVWSGEDVDCVVIGIGVNVLTASVPAAEVLQFPATSLEEQLGQAPERVALLQEILASLIELRSQLGTDEFLAQWENLLALREETVQVESEKTPAVSGQISGLDSDGSLIIRNVHGEFVTVRFGDVRLRPLA